MKNSPEVSPILFQKHFKSNTTEAKEAGYEGKSKFRKKFRHAFKKMFVFVMHSFTKVMCSI